MILNDYFEMKRQLSYYYYYFFFHLINEMEFRTYTMTTQLRIIFGNYFDIFNIALINNDFSSLLFLLLCLVTL